MKTRLIFPTETIITPSMHGKDIVLRGGVSGHIFLSQSLPAGFTCRITQSGDGVGILTPMGNGTVNGTSGMLATRKASPVTLTVESNGGNAPVIRAYGPLDNTEILHLNHHQRAHPNWTPSGGCVTTSVQSRFGGGSLALDGLDDRILHAPNNPLFDLGTGDATIDLWVRYNTVSPSLQVFFTKYQNANNFYSLYSSTAESQSIRFRFLVGGTDIIGIPGTGLVGGAALAINTWYHVALTISGTTCRIFLNGNLLASGTFSGTRANFSGNAEIGAFNATYFTNGHIDEFRFVRTALWTAGFTPPTGEL